MAVLTAETEPAAKARETGDLWEVTFKMSMEGMPMEMPAHRMKVCTTREWKKPPAPENEQQKCQYSDFKVVGPKATRRGR
jgi:hypothetical protein